MKPILVAGEINVDVILGGCSRMPQPDTEVLAESFAEVPGSSSMICAMGLAQLGDAVAFVGHVGDDARGRFCMDAMRKVGIDVSAVHVHPQVATGITVSLSTAEDHAAVTFPGCIAMLEAADVDDASLARCGHLHVSSFYLQRRLRPQLRELFGRARAVGLSTSLDPDFDPEQRWDDDWPALLEQVDVFLPNQREACAIARCDDVGAALQHFANGTTRVVVKCAQAGATILDAEGELLKIPSRPPAKVCDSTGAGDSFNAGFLHAWLARRPLDECLRWGNACGSLSTRGMGGTACQPGTDEVRTWLEQAP